MHNDTPLGIVMYFKELDRQVAPGRPARRMLARRILEATGSVFHHSGKFHRKIQIWLGHQGKETLTDVASRSRPARAAG